MTLVFKILKGLNHPYICDMFNSVSEVSSQLTRSSQSNNLYVHRNDLCVNRRSLRYNGAVLYKTLGNIIQNSQSVASFKVVRG